MFWLDANIAQIAPQFFPQDWDSQNIREVENAARKTLIETKQTLDREFKRARSSVEELERRLTSSKNSEASPLASLTSPLLPSEDSLQDKQKKLKELESNMEKLESWNGLGVLPQRLVTVIEKHGGDLFFKEEMIILLGLLIWKLYAMPLGFIIL